MQPVSLVNWEMLSNPLTKLKHAGVVRMAQIALRVLKQGDLK